MNRLKSDVQMTLMSRVPVMLLSFLSVVFLTRLLGPEGNGVYTFTMAALNLFFTIIGFQLEGSLPVFVAKEKEDRPGIFSAVTLLALMSFIAFAIVLSVIVFLIPGGDKYVIAPGQPILFFFVFLLAAFLLRRMSTLMLAALRGTFKFKAYNIYMIIAQLIPALAYGFLLLLTASGGLRLSVEACFRMILSIEAFLVLVGAVILYRSKVVSFSSNYHKHIGPVSSLSAKSIVSSAGHFLNKRLDVWFVQFYKGTAMLGQYGLATQVTNFVSDAMTPFNQVLIPYIAEATPDQHNAIVERTARLNLTMALCAALLIMGTSWIFIPLLFGKDFGFAVPATQILAIGIIFISQRLVFTGYFKAINAMRYPVRAAWTGVIITVALDILLIPGYGIIGAAWATTLSYGASAVYLILVAKQKLGFQWSHILIVKPSDIKWLLSKTKKLQDD